MGDEPVTGTPEKDAAMAIKRMGPELAARVFGPSPYTYALRLRAAALLQENHPRSVDAAERKAKWFDHTSD
jgi:hypothetical protein